MKLTKIIFSILMVMMLLIGSIVPVFAASQMVCNDIGFYELISGFSTDLSLEISIVETVITFIVYLFCLFLFKVFCDARFNHEASNLGNLLFSAFSFITGWCISSAISNEDTFLFLVIFSVCLSLSGLILFIFWLYDKYDDYQRYKRFKNGEETALDQLYIKADTLLHNKKQRENNSVTKNANKEENDDLTKNQLKEQYKNEINHKKKNHHNSNKQNIVKVHRNRTRKYKR